MMLDPGALDRTLDRLTGELLARRTPAGYWEGRLSSSALSTATAVTTLALDDPAVHRELISRGIDWLVRNQNADGGWGDTVLSVSNISTTALCWAAFGAAGQEAASVGAAGRAESWLRRAAGSLDPEALSKAIASRYGRDRTFSVPILTMLALAGRLGPGSEAWRHVPQLPFELAALPRSWFRWLQLPVVSYALPALIAIGQVRHHHHASLNPIARLARRATVSRTLCVLEETQPSSGGFLEATPLTSFVTMSLIAAGHGGHPVARRGVEFLARSARLDGSWPIDTNLATWVTTLAVNALAADGAAAARLSVDERRCIREWLLGQQYAAEHAYTGAAPGGWAWTDLPGGVPDADDTSGALLALKNLGPVDETARRAARAGVIWLLDLQNRDGGIPTFCHGWGRLPFDRSSPDITAHALEAWAAWQDHLEAPAKARVVRASEHALRYLAAQQRADGAWSPLWFGNQYAPEEENLTYGTARVASAIRRFQNAGAMTQRAIQWLLAAQNPDGGWGGAAGIESSVEETAVAVAGLSSYPEKAESAIRRGVEWLVKEKNRGPAPIGFYFANLWYFEEMYPLVFSVKALAGVRRSLRGSA